MVRSPAGIERRIPTWAAGVVGRLAAERRNVVTRTDIERHLGDRANRDTESALRELQRTGWIAPLHVKGTWAFFPPGEDEVTDQYLDLRAWHARDSTATFALAGEATAWHLGYVRRAITGPVPIWVPEGERPPHGLRPHVVVVRLGWDRGAVRRFVPTASWLRSRGLDITQWSSGLSSFGPEALLVQMAARPSSIRAWADIVPNLAAVNADVSADRLIDLLGEQSGSAWQRAAYLIHCGGDHDKAVHVLDRRPSVGLHHVTLGRTGPALFVPEFGITDHLVAPLQGLIGKA